MSAIISECGRYRYVLRRDDLPSIFGVKRKLTWVMLNPSTADAVVDDPTIRKCAEFARRNDYGGIVVVNLFALRSSNPNDIYGSEDPIGPLNDGFIEGETLGDRDVVVAWGAHGDAFPGRVDHVVSKLLGDRDVLCLGTTKSGQPKHPLYVPYDQPLIPWRP